MAAKKKGNAASKRQHKAVNSAKESRQALPDSAEDPPADDASQVTDSKTQAHTPRKRFPVVGIGASAGGLEALEALLKNMPADTGMAFVIVTHQHPGHTSLLPELLAKDTRMQVVEAADGTQLEPNHVYVSPPGAYLAILDGRLQRMQTQEEQSPRLPIDYFFRSLAESHEQYAICIVLSGTGSDGTLGVKAVKGASGMTMAQQPQSAKYAGMPSSAISTGLIDYVLTLQEIPKQLLAYAQGPYLVAAQVSPSQPTVPVEPMQKIFVLLRTRTGHDFSAYKSNTIRRRIERRMNVHQINQPNQYVRYLQENPHEIDLLFKELLISVTSFFRDPQVWESLRNHLENFLRSRPEGYTLRAWVPGCATGEEAYSLAILLRECMDKTKRHLDVQIFATDLDTEAIEKARAGQYPEGIAVDLSPKRLERYFVREGATYRIQKNIREMVIFATQNVIKDPPFTKLDVLSCRNLLIYLNTDLQKKLLPIFHYALKPTGFLLLGPSETIGSFTDLFEPLDKRWKIFHRTNNAVACYILPEIPAQPHAKDKDVPVSIDASNPSGEGSLASLIERLLLGRFSPASVIVNERGDIIYINGRTGDYLEPSPGQPRHNVLDMARPGLQIELAAALRECIRTGEEVLRSGVRIKSNGTHTLIDLAVTKLLEPEAIRGLLLITFRPTPTDTAKPTTSKADAPPHFKKGEGNRSEWLERELRHMKESYQTTLEELETSNEELKSTNEELQSTNEELQSTNEELETSKEEMQSLNEELTTVNSELQSKIDDLSQANDDMQNLLDSTDIATIFLDNDLNIKRFTEKAKDLIKLVNTDVGRPISDLVSNLRDNNVTSDCTEVLRTLVFKERQTVTQEGTRYLMRIMPYRTSHNAIEGLVITFVNIEQLRVAQEIGEADRSYFENMFDTLREPLLVLDARLKVVSANKAYLRTFRTSRKQSEGTNIFEIASGQWDLPELREQIEKVLTRGTPFEDLEIVADFPRIGRRIFLLNARRLEHESGQPGMILLAFEDVTGR